MIALLSQDVVFAAPAALFNKTRQINCLPAVSRKRHEQFNPKPEIGARRRQAVTALGRSAKEMKIFAIISAAISVRRR